MHFCFLTEDWMCFEELVLSIEPLQLEYCSCYEMPLEIRL